MSQGQPIGRTGTLGGPGGGLLCGVRAGRCWCVLLLLMFGLAAGGLWSSPALAGSGAGSALAWGDNEFGELGNGTMTSSLVPVGVSEGAVPSGATFTQVGVGAMGSLALSSTGQLYAWGDNNFGELGNGTMTGSSVPVAVAAGAIPPGTTISQIAAGGFHNLALSSTGQLYAWGDNLDGELGNGTTTGWSVPVAVAAGAIPPGTTITQIAAGFSYSLALSSTGQVYAWGDNLDGELGNGTTTGSPVPVAVAAGAIPPGTTITQIAAGGHQSLALSSTGQLYAWGDNIHGELGNGTTTSSPVPVAVSAGAIPPGTHIIQIAAGVLQSLALSSTGQVYAWGDNLDGELGNGTTTGSPVPVAVSAGAIPPGTTIVQIAAGNLYSLALSSTGQVYAWGANLLGELGSGTTTSSSVPVAVSLRAGTTIDALARGSVAAHALAIIGNLSLTSSSLAAGTVDRSYSSALAGEGGATPYRFSATGLPPGLTLDPASGEISGTPTVAGSYTVAAGLTDADNLATARSTTLTIAPLPTPTLTPTPTPTPTPTRCPAGQTGTPPNCHIPPTLTHLTQLHRAWREPNSRPRNAPIGTTFSFTLNQAATVTLAFTQKTTGRTLRRKCVAPTRRNRHQPPCTLTSTRGRLSLAAHAGTTKSRFQGRIAKSKHLKPGKYTLTITATNPAHQRSKRQTLTFTIVK